MSKQSLRDGFGRGLVEAARRGQAVVGLCADLMSSLKMDEFAQEFPDRFVQAGIAEQNMVTLASGMAAMGKKPFAASYAAFNPGRNWEQIRTTICLNDQPVCIVGSHAGLSVGPDGATHQMLEDIALMRSLPNMVVIAPGDSLEAQQATEWLAGYNAPSYLRLTREPVALFGDDNTFEFGKARTLWDGHDVAIISTGTITHHCLEAVKILEESGVHPLLLHVATIKPLDEAAIIETLQKTGRAVTVEDGQVAGGFGSAIAELSSLRLPVPIKRLGVEDAFGMSGKPDELYDHFGLSAPKIAESVKEFITHNPRYHQGG